ncbi:MAG: AMP-binding protein [Candidatus Azotimanducaceae bacterium]|nr:feruloyl-CoA synthetase [Gammaproteobacteria bacterium]OUV68076.1 MAG: hypothetical protein CBC93_03450 [Gammaproteobacteria bacterium TMED133]
MYKLALSRSETLGQDDDEVLNCTVGELLREAAFDSANTLALVECEENGEVGKRWSYAELLADSEELALRLAGLFKQGERIAVWAPNIPEWVILEYAAALAGVVLVPVNPAYRPAELEYVLKQSDAVALFLVPSFRGNPMRQIAREVVAEISAVRLVCEMQNLHEMLNQLAMHGPQKIDLPIVDSMDPVQIQYTSGTTGFPKGALLHHRGIINNGKFVLKRIGMGKDQIFLNPMPMFHCSGCVVATLGCAQLRSTMILSLLFEPSKILDLIMQERVSAMLSVPTMLVSMIETQQQSPRNLDSLNVIISGGSMVPPELVKQVETVLGAKTSIVYGQTETSPVVTQTRIDDDFIDMTETIGQPLPCTDISIRSVEDNTVVPINIMGEICTRGYCNMLCYNDNPKATSQTIDSAGWLHTGDVGSMDSRGFLKITGRLKEMIIRGGENLFPVEIENRLLEHSQIIEAAVVGVFDQKWGEVVVAFIRIRSEIIEVEELVGFCRQKLSPQKTPKHWVFMNEWPLTGSGKIQKITLRKKFEEGGFEVVSR